MGAAEKLKDDPSKRELDQVVSGTHANPHTVLGAHTRGAGTVVVRVWRPDSTAVSIVVDGTAHEAVRVHDAGVWAVELKRNDPPAYVVRVSYGDSTYDVEDP